MEIVSVSISMPKDLEQLFMKHYSIIVDVLYERQRQNKKFGEDRHQHPLVWNAILGEEKGEVDKAILEWMYTASSFDDYGKELKEVAAVAIAAMLDIYQNGEPKK